MTAARPGPEELLAGYLAAQRARDAGNGGSPVRARVFLRRWPDPQVWAAQPLSARAAANSSTRPLLNHLMLFGYLRPGYDYLLERRLPAVLREAKGSPMAADLDTFLAAAAELGFTTKTAAGMASQIAMRMLIQTGRRLGRVDRGRHRRLRRRDERAGNHPSAVVQALPRRIAGHPHGALSPRRTGGWRRSRTVRICGGSPGGT